MGFKWPLVMDEMNQHAPVLLQILNCCTSTRRLRANRNSVIATCTAMLCKLRSSKMSLIHKVLSLVLYAGHASKKVAIYSSLSGINGTLVIIVIFIGIYTISQTWDLYVS